MRNNAVLALASREDKNTSAHEIRNEIAGPDWFAGEKGKGYNEGPLKNILNERDREC
jgi:hypothetical protein